MSDTDPRPHRIGWASSAKIYPVGPEGRAALRAATLPVNVKRYRAATAIEQAAEEAHRKHGRG